MRLRLSQQVHRPDLSTGVLLPLYLSRVRAGFPSPADEYIDRELDLNQHLIRNPQATFIVRAEGDSMIGEGIYSGDVLIVDRSVQPRHNSIVIACIGGELTVKKLIFQGGKPYLAASNPDFQAIEIRDLMILFAYSARGSNADRVGQAQQSSTGRPNQRAP